MSFTLTLIFLENTVISTLGRRLRKERKKREESSKGEEKKWPVLNDRDVDNFINVSVIQNGPEEDRQELNTKKSLGWAVSVLKD